MKVFESRTQSYRGVPSTPIWSKAKANSIAQKTSMDSLWSSIWSTELAQISLTRTRFPLRHRYCHPPHPPSWLWTGRSTNSTGTTSLSAAWYTLRLQYFQNKWRISRGSSRQFGLLSFLVSLNIVDVTLNYSDCYSSGLTTRQLYHKGSTR